MIKIIEKESEEEQSTLMKQVLIEGVLYYFMPIPVAIKYADKIQSGFFIPLSETKRVRIQFGDSDLDEKLSNYQEKGLESILLAEEDYYNFLKAIKGNLISFFLKSESSEVRTLNMAQMYILIRKAVTYIGLNEEDILESEDITKKVIENIKGISKVYGPLRVFIKDNQDEFLKNMLVAYSGIALANALGWKTPGIKDKIVQICLFSDITLTSADYFNIIIADGNKSKLSKNVMSHPLDAARIVSTTKNAFGREVIQAIEQHHELPCGSGYPKKIKGLAINQLSALQIVSRTFIDTLVISNFSYDDRKEFILSMVSKFNFPNFAQPCKALFLIMDIEPEKQAYHD